MASAVRRLLNRAVASSPSDAAFLAEMGGLAASEPHALLHGCLQCATLDADQAELIYHLFVRSPSLGAFFDSPDEGAMVLQCVRDDVFGATSPPARQDAVLLFAARLTQPRGKREATDESGAAAEALPPLVERDAMLMACILPLLRHTSGAGGGALELPLRATLQLLSGRAELLTAQQLSEAAIVRPISTDSLTALLSALLLLLERRASIAVECVHLLLRCTHASVQLLLPRAASSDGAEMDGLLASCRTWEDLRWRTQMHAWPLIDRLSSRQQPPTRAAERLVSWLQRVAQPSGRAQTLACLVVCAGAPSVPLRQALPLVLGDDTPPAEVLGALACGLAQGSPTEWQHAVSKLLPALHACAALPDPTPSAAAASMTLPMPEADVERQLVRGAHCLLRAMLAMNGHASQAVSWLQQGRLTFASGFARWLAAAVRAANEPLAAAHVLGVAVRAASVCPAAANERYFVLRLAAKKRVLELRESAVAHVDEQLPGAGEGAAAGRAIDPAAWTPTHRRHVELLKRNLAVAPFTDQREPGAQIDCFVPIDQL